MSSDGRMTDELEKMASSRYNPGICMGRLNKPSANRILGILPNI
jgi:hypothetical protein